MNRALPFLGVLILAVLPACAGTGDSTQNPGTSPQDDAALYEWLVGEEVPTSSVLRVDVDLGRLDEKIDGDPRYKVGVAEPVRERVTFDAVDAGQLSWTAQPASFGAIRSEGNGGFVWSAVVESPGATAIRLELTDVYIARGTQLWVYGDAGEVFGPFTGEGPRGTSEFSVNTLLGEHAYLQLRHEGRGAAQALADTHFTIDDVGYLDGRFKLGRRFLDRRHCDTIGPDQGTASCVVNSECPAYADMPNANVRYAIAEMLFRSGGSYYLCSGGLLADTDDNTQIPYFLTANHCISKGREASTLETYWDFWVSCGTTACDYAWTSGRTTPGATLLAHGRAGDYSLSVLDAVPGGRYYLPWNNQAVTDGEHLQRISHPFGAPQAYSDEVAFTDPSAGPNCGSQLPHGQFIYSFEGIGATQGGSSGSPVLNDAGEVVGQLYGVCGSNISDDCDHTNNATVDGALASYFSNVAQWLDPGPGCTVTEDPEVSCNDGVDNDCDGLVDSADPDCGGGQCTDPPVCTSNADCCSNKCKGKPGAKTCK